MKRSRLWVCCTAVLIGGCVGQSPTPQQIETPQLVKQVVSGRQLAEQRCSSCHAIGVADTSPRKGAPPLRNLYGRYPTEGVRTSFLNGIHVGHADMPTFHLSRSEVEALLSYLASIDPCAQPSTDRAAMARCFAPL